MNLRDYQNKFVSNISAKLRHFKRICAQLATGGGKTVCFATISHRYTQKSGKAVLILVHRKELLQQTRATLYNMYGITAELIVAGTRYIPPAKVYIGMVESVNKRIERIKNIGLVIIDEAHIAIFNKMHFHFPDQFIIGFTATPVSSNKKFPVKVFYEDIVCGIDIPDLIKQGFLCQNITRAPKDIVARQDLAIKNGEYDESKMATEFSKAKHVHNVVFVYEKWSAGLKTLIFNVNISHSQEVCAAFVAAGYDCRHLDGEDNTGKRANTLKWFKETPNAILCNVGVLTAGFDEPTIETVIVNKATLSMPLWLQMTGRGSRPTPSKSIFNIIDMGGNAMAHGDWCDARDWEDLFNNPRKPGEGGIPPCKECPECEGIVPASTHVCSLINAAGEICGYVFPTKIAAQEEIMTDFVIITKNIDARALINANRDKKEHFAFYRIGTHLADQAKKSIEEMNDEKANFILQKYLEHGKVWASQVTTNRMADWEAQEWEEGQPEPEKPKKIIFSQWYQHRAKEHLFEHLAKHYPKWSNPISAYTQMSTLEPQTH